MESPFILHMLSPLRHVSPFDVNMALDAGFNAVVPYISVEEREVKGLVQDAIFSRGPKGVKRTAIFIGGKNAILALDMLEEARHAMVPPFVVSVFADPAGSFTTAAAMVACVEKTLKNDRCCCGIVVFLPLRGIPCGLLSGPCFSDTMHWRAALVPSPSC